VDAWLDELPPVLSSLATQWQVEVVALIPRGRMSVVISVAPTDRWTDR
jgi:hypothetical protein